MQRIPYNMSEMVITMTPVLSYIKILRSSNNPVSTAVTLQNLLVTSLEDRYEKYILIRKYVNLFFVSDKPKSYPNMKVPLLQKIYKMQKVSKNLKSPESCKPNNK